jgi:hypothetical protein
LPYRPFHVRQELPQVVVTHYARKMVVVPRDYALTEHHLRPRVHPEQLAVGLPCMSVFPEQLNAVSK